MIINLKVNIFVAIEKINDLCGSKVNFYSVRLESAEVNEFYDFLDRMEDIPECSDDLNNLVEWLDKI